MKLFQITTLGLCLMLGCEAPKPAPVVTPTKTAEASATEPSAINTAAQATPASTAPAVAASTAPGGSPGVTPQKRPVGTAPQAQAVVIAEESGDSSIREIGALETGFSGPVTFLAFLPDDRLLAACGNDAEVRIFQWKEKKQLAKYGAAYPWAISPDGQVLATKGFQITEDGKFIYFPRLLDVATGKMPKAMEALPTKERDTAFKGFPQDIFTMCFSPNGKVLAAGGGEVTRSGMIYLWDAATGKELSQITGYTREVTALSFSPNGRLLAISLDDGHVKIWDVMNGAEITTVKDEHPAGKAITFSHDGQMLAAGRFKSVTLWNITRWEKHNLSGDDAGVYNLAFSPNGRVLAATFPNAQTVKLWDAIAGWKEISGIPKQSGQTFGLAFNQESVLAVGSHPGVVKFYAVPMGK